MVETWSLSTLIPSMMESIGRAKIMFCASTKSTWITAMVKGRTKVNWVPSFLSVQDHLTFEVHDVPVDD